MEISLISSGLESFIIYGIAIILTMLSIGIVLNYFKFLNLPIWFVGILVLSTIGIWLFILLDLLVSFVTANPYRIIIIAIIIAALTLVVRKTSKKKIKRKKK